MSFSETRRNQRPSRPRGSEIVGSLSFPHKPAMLAPPQPTGGMPMIRILAVLALMAASVAALANTLQPPDGRKIRVAVVLTEGAVVIDFAGPWEVFENVHTGT